ncbi:Uncharacterized protein dnm_087560 [Desulfonema magnum]|uniref:Uncharacterized protein n=1 Tax=Desulfonema magnum TaxID=45655 RepID=A0A975GU02_9BACT|nr:Uncharacterized protein dnm_087550 [Desulfonema magnum]QTA92669.1 Uncharacterized protein dnm_087560 [Desulfonema magnum]
MRIWLKSISENQKFFLFRSAKIERSVFLHRQIENFCFSGVSKKSLRSIFALHFSRNFFDLLTILILPAKQFFPLKRDS